MTRTHLLAPALVATLVLAGCDAPGAEAEEPRRAPHDQGACETATIEHTNVDERPSPTGGTLVHVGAELGRTAVVPVADILARPEEFAGKTVQVRGQVSSMCTHRRGWFAVVTDDQSGRHLRVLTAPSFLVPEDAVGTTARAEGTIEAEELTRERADYFNKNHKLSYPEGTDGVIRQAVLRATGADFE